MGDKIYYLYDMVIRIPISFTGSKGEKKLYSLFDTGSTYSCIRNDIAEKMGVADRLPVPMYFGTASENQYLEVENRTTLNFEINDITLSDEFMIVPELSEEIIIGATTMQKWRIKLDFEHDAVIVDPRVAKLILKDLK